VAQVSTLRRARRLVTFATFAPPVLFDLYFVPWSISEGTFEYDGLFVSGGLTLGLWLLGLWPFLGSRKSPNAWSSVGFPGLFLLLILFADLQGSKYQDWETSHYVSAVATVLVVAAVISLLPLLAKKMVFADLSSPEIIESDLVFTFKPLRGSTAILTVGLDGVAVSEDTRRDDAFHARAALSDVSTVTTWTEVEDTEWEIPGDEEERTLSLPAGELLGVSYDDSQLVVAIRDPDKAKRFIEARVALAHEQAAAVDE
jgi:hypothetical protein